MLKSCPGWRRAVTVACLVAVLSPAAAGLAADPQDELDEVTDQLDDAQSDLEGVEQRKAVELSDLQRLDARRAALDQQLATLGRRLDAAEAELADSQAQLDATTQQLTATEARLSDTRKRLAASRNALAERTRATYMYGGRATWASVVAGLDNMEDFQRGVKYARSVLRSDQQRVERITALEVVVERTTLELGKLQEQHAAQRAVDAERRDAAAAIVAERQEVARKVAAEAAERRRLIARLETDRRSYVAMVQNLQAESRNLEQELARIAAAQRARELAAKREAAAEARRLASIANERQEAAPPAAVAGPSTSSALLWPANGPKTSDYGWRTHPIFGTRRFHAGIDIGAGYGAPIYAAADGVVVSAGARSGYGNTVVIDHGDGIATLSGHQSSVAVSGGQQVNRGDTIGYVGSTGYSTGPHLHFEVRVDGVPRDPMAYF